MNHKDTIKELLRSTNTTQAQLGQRVGLTQQAISNYRNRDDILLSTYVRIINALGYDIKIVRRDELTQETPNNDQ
jgi:transcriptional regulator with XRE-family HTH domain